MEEVIVLGSQDRYFTDMRVFVDEVFARGGFEINLCLNDGNRDTFVIDEVRLKKVNPNIELSSGIFLKHEVAKQLMNQLWLRGLRPSDDVASVGQLEAMKDHIDTLKKRTDYLQQIIDKLIPTP